MEQIEHKLKQWVEKGLISTGQAQAILAQEEAAPERSWAVYGFIGVGATALMAGVVSLVAANWDSIPVLAKLLSYFASQGLLGFWVYRRRDTDGPLRELLIVVFCLWFLAGIGLISQVYNISGASWRAAAFWAALTLPSTLLARGRLVNHLWMAAFCAAAGLWATSDYRHTEQLSRMTAIQALPFLLFGFSLVKPKHFPSRFIQAVQNWSLLWLGAMTVPSSAMTAARSHGMHFLLPPSGETVLLAALIAAGCAVYSFRSNILLRLFVTLGLMLDAAFVLLGLGDFTSDIVSALLFIAVWSCAAFSAALAERRRLFDFATFLIGVRFIVAYFQVFGTLSTTGVGLIVSGLLIIGFAFAWHRYRRRIAVWLENAG